MPSKVFINKFRNIIDLDFELGSNITVLSGQNGVGKSSILSLIASGSGINRSSYLRNKLQPEFEHFFNIDETENFTEYDIYIQYSTKIKKNILTKRLSFNNYSENNRGIRIIPRATNRYTKYETVKKAQEDARKIYGVGESARIQIPTIYLSISRLYPLGEGSDNVSVKSIGKTSKLYKSEIDKKYREWYNKIIPDSIETDAELSEIDKNVTSRSSLYMDIENTPTLSQSIGQDSVGNIVTALVDIYMLSLEDNYSGSVLCIDEVDVSLHPKTQLNLLNLFEELSNELNIRFILTTHSLTILKEMVTKEMKYSDKFKVVYLKNPSMPMIQHFKSYELLKADLFEMTKYNPPRVKVYFEDDLGRKLFQLLVDSFIYKFKRIKTEKYEYDNLEKKILDLESILDIEKKINVIETYLGCEELVNISKADKYFDRVIIILDGDARRVNDKPKVKDYLDKKFESNPENDRSHKPNICFLPDYFAPESFFYRIIYKLTNEEREHFEFWKSLSYNENTCLYTATKIKEKFSKLGVDFNNDDLKNIFNDEVIDFIVESKILEYYYDLEQNTPELVDFMDNLNKAYKMTYSKTIANKYS